MRGSLQKIPKLTLNLTRRASRTSVASSKMYLRMVLRVGMSLSWRLGRKYFKSRLKLSLSTNENAYDFSCWCMHVKDSNASTYPVCGDYHFNQIVAQAIGGIWWGSWLRDHDCVQCPLSSAKSQWITQKEWIENAYSLDKSISGMARGCITMFSASQRALYTLKWSL